MSAYELSVTGRTSRPYYLPLLGINLYSVEELLYFMCRHPALLQAELRNSRLLAWLSEEFGMTRVTYAMQRGLSDESDPALFVLPLLRETAYLNAQELQQFLKELQSFEHASAEQRLRMTAMELYDLGRYGAADELCRKAVSEAKPSERAFLAGIAEIRGGIRMQLLNWQEGASFFEEAYRLHPTKERLRLLLLALRLTKPREAYEEAAAALEADEALLEEVKGLVDAAYAAVLPEDPDPSGALSELCDRYHTESGV